MFGDMASFGKLGTASAGLLSGDRLPPLCEDLSKEHVWFRTCSLAHSLMAPDTGRDASLLRMTPQLRRAPSPAQTQNKTRAAVPLPWMATLDDADLLGPAPQLRRPPFPPQAAEVQHCVSALMRRQQGPAPGSKHTKASHRAVSHACIDTLEHGNDLTLLRLPRPCQVDRTSAAPALLPSSAIALPPQAAKSSTTRQGMEAATKPYARAQGH
jgi:hypothetical protein